MSATTTLKLSDDLKQRITSVAEAQGKSPHAFMVAAIEAHAALAERRPAFVESALRAEDEVAQHGLAYDGDEVLSYLKHKLTGKSPAQPRKRKL